MSTVWNTPTPARPFVAFLPPIGPLLDRYDPNRLPQDQHQSTRIPDTFIDAMIVREQVFVREQHVPLKYEFDSDDARSCHWVVYESNCPQEDEVTDPITGAVTLPESARATAVPIGTIRLVPFPHAPHPKDGRFYVDGGLIGEQDPTLPEGVAPIGYQDRATTHHDGKEPYIKLGRLSIVQTHRGRCMAGMLINAALDFAMFNWDFFDHAGPGGDQGPRAEWKGLVCVHAQFRAIKVWQRHGFILDDLMGKWYEESIAHMGMFRRVEKHVD